MLAVILIHVLTSPKKDETAVYTVVDPSLFRAPSHIGTLTSLFSGSASAMHLLAQCISIIV